MKTPVKKICDKYKTQFISNGIKRNSFNRLYLSLRKSILDD
jgi:hypothetical protein